MKRAVVVEDEPRMRAEIAAELQEEGLVVEAVASAEEALTAVRAGCDLLLVDVRLPGMSGVQLVHRLVEAGRLPPTIVVTGEATISETVEGLRAGVLDFVEKPFTRERLRTSVRNALTRNDLQQEVWALRRVLAVEEEMLGESEAMACLRARIERAAVVDATVLVRGESGTGKELVATALHRLSGRRSGPFVKLNCAAIPGTLAEAELFGHARGAFTGAVAARGGLFEQANGGTLFLDEIGDMELPLQSRLLRVLEERRVRRLGEARDRPVDVRVVAATNQDLETAVRQRRFREDLFFRIAHLPIDVPPLRDRHVDVTRLALHFVELFSRRHHLPVRQLAPETLSALDRYPWPGNVRELRHLCERLVVFGSDPITPDQLPENVLVGAGASQKLLLQLSSLSQPLALRDLRQRCEREYLEWVLARCGWNVTAAARALDVGRTHLHEKLVALDLVRPPSLPGKG